MNPIADIFSIISEFPPSPQPIEAPFCQPAAPAKPLSEPEVHADEFDLFSFFEEVDASERQWEKEKAQRALEAGTPVLLRTDTQSKQSCWIKKGE